MIKYIALTIFVFLESAMPHHILRLLLFLCMLSILMRDKNIFTSVLFLIVRDALVNRYIGITGSSFLLSFLLLTGIGDNLSSVKRHIVFGIVFFVSYDVLLQFFSGDFNVVFLLHAIILNSLMQICLVHFEKSKR